MDGKRCLVHVDLLKISIREGVLNDIRITTIFLVAKSLLNCSECFNDPPTAQQAFNIGVFARFLSPNVLLYLCCYQYISSQ